jgi:hypothetical protein
VVCGRSQRVLVGAAVDRKTLQLLGSRVAYRPTVTFVRVRPRMSVTSRAIPKSANKIRRLSCLGLAEQNVGGFDIAVKQSAIMCVVQCVGDSGNDLNHLARRHSRRLAIV